MTMSEYGYCPLCCQPVSSRQRRPDGNDRCKMGHEFPSAMADKKPKFGQAMATTRHAFNAILQSDAQRSHSQLQELAEWLEGMLDEVNRMELTVR